MIVSTTRDGIHEINAWPAEIEEKLISLEPGEVIKVRLNPGLWFNVFEQKGTSHDFNRPLTSGMVKKVGQHGIPSPWTIRWERQPYQIGFLEGYDATGTPRYNRPIFNQQGELTFSGDKVGDRERFFVMQLHPQMRTDPLTGLERKTWKFEIVDTEKESVGITQNFEAKLALLNKIKDLNETSLNILMGGGMYERAFYGRPDLVSKPKGSRALLIKAVEDGKIKEVADSLKRLDEALKIGLIHDGLNNRKLICTENKLMRYDGREILTFPEPVTAGNNEEAAIAAFKYGSHSEEFEEQVIEFLRETYESSKTTTHKARRGVKPEE
jgi:hypothetical protein